MKLADALREIEDALGIRYPPGAAAQLAQLPAGMTVLATVDEVASARARMPSELVPFTSELQAGWSDYYVFAGSGVAVWADHAVVMEWPSFAVFLDWLIARRG